MIDNDDDDERSARAVLCAELARQRTQAGWTLAELGEKSLYDPSYLQRLEKGDRLGSRDAIAALDRLYGTGRLLADLWRLAKREASQSRYKGFIDLEAEAMGIHEFSVSTVPGLLQTTGYAEALLRTRLRARDPDGEDLLAEHVRARVGRQDRLTGARPLNYRGILDESVIRRPPCASVDVWTEQVTNLIEVSQQPNVSLQVAPFGVGLHNLLGSSLQLLWLPSGRTVAYVESSWSGELIEETEEVEHLRVSYDRLRDSALTAAESVALLRTALEGQTPCTTPDNQI